MRSAAFAFLPFIAFSVLADEAELNIKLSNFSDNQDNHCLYKNLSSAASQVVACSDYGEFVLNATLEKNTSYVASIQVKNEVTQEWVVNGSVHYTVDANGNVIQEHANGIDALGYYQFDNNFEYYLKPSTSVVLFSEKNFEGETIHLTESMADLGHLNLNMNSYRIPSTWQVRFYEGKNFTGGYYTRGESAKQSIFDEAEFEPRVQSMRVLSK